jgi:hypothetical protein
VPQSFDPEFVRTLTDHRAFEDEARKVVEESDRRIAENERFRRENPRPFEAVRARVKLTVIVVAVVSFPYAVLSLVLTKVPPLWTIGGVAATLLYLVFVRWPTAPPLPFHSGILTEESRNALLDNASRAARNNARVIEKLGRSNGYVLFLRSFQPEFEEARRTENLRIDLKDEPYRIKEYSPDAEMLLLKNLLKRTRLPSVANVLVQVPDLRLGWTFFDECEELVCPIANWLQRVEHLADGAKALVFVISSRRGTGITQELDSLCQRGIPVMAVCEKQWLESYAAHLPKNVLVVTDTSWKYDDTDFPTWPRSFHITTSVTERELQEYDQRLERLLAEAAKA